MVMAATAAVRGVAAVAVAVAATTAVAGAVAVNHCDHFVADHQAIEQSCENLPMPKQQRTRPWNWLSHVV